MRFYHGSNHLLVAIRQYKVIPLISLLRQFQMVEAELDWVVASVLPTSQIACQ